MDIDIRYFLWFQMTVMMLKEKIADVTGTPVVQQRLIFRGKVLKDDHPLSSYCILFFILINRDGRRPCFHYVSYEGKNVLSLRVL